MCTRYGYDRVGVNLKGIFEILRIGRGRRNGRKDGRKEERKEERVEGRKEGNECAREESWNLPSMY